MRHVSTLLLCAASLLTCGLLTDSAWAHGGRYRGPAGEVPDGSREPSDPPPPPAGDGPRTPGGETDGGPETGPGGDVGGPETGGDPGTPGTGTGGPSPSGTGPTGPTTGPGKAPGAGKGPGYAGWTFWWNFNKDELLGLRRTTRGVRHATGSSLNAFGRRRGGGEAIISATRAAVNDRVVPALVALVQDDDVDFDVRSAAALALAKIGHRPIVPVLKDMVRNEGDANYHRVVEESAALAFGFLGSDDDDVRDFLIETLRDDDKNASRVRPFAAVSLGLLGSEGDADHRVVRALLEILAGKQAKTDLKPACLVALGLLDDETAVPELLHMLRTGRVRARGAEELSELDTAFVVQALGKLGRPGVEGADSAVLDEVCRLVTVRKKRRAASRNVARSAAIAIGQIAPQCDEADFSRALKTLKTVVRTSPDDSERNFAMIAMGRMAGSAAPDARREIVTTLGYYLSKGKPANLARPFAGLSLGLVGHAMGAHAVGEEEIRRPLRDKFEHGRKGDPKVRGAYAIASGLVGDPLAVASMVDVLSDRGNDSRLRGQSALALGMIGDDSAREAIHLALSDESDRDLRVQTAMGAGLMGDAGVVKGLVGILESGEDSQYVLGSAALALGQIGDERAIDPLLAIAQDPESKYPAITRALATVALGQIGDRNDVPVLARVSSDINFRALGGADALVELLTIL